jgi:hypothetical protein
MTRIYNGIGRHTPVRVQLVFAGIYVLLLVACAAVVLGAIL